MPLCLQHNVVIVVETSPPFHNEIKFCSTHGRGRKKSHTAGYYSLSYASAAAGISTTKFLRKCNKSCNFLLYSLVFSPACGKYITSSKNLVFPKTRTFLALYVYFVQSMYTSNTLMNVGWPLKKEGQSDLSSITDRSLRSSIRKRCLLLLAREQKHFYSL